MAVRALVAYENPVLRQKAKRISRFDGSLQTLIDDMVETMHVEAGVGLAAPQIGISIRLCVIEIPAEYEDEPLAGQLIVLVNPEVVKGTDPVDMEEGCLSIPGYSGTVKRFRHVTVKGRDRQGKELRYKGSELLAQAFQHEIDHLNGILYVDRLDSPDLLRKNKRSRGEAAEAATGTETADGGEIDELPEPAEARGYRG